MAETSDKAFGRYLRTLRERRGLALHDVASLSSSFPEAISKGYLSRCENGYLTPSFSKVIALSRIYEVPADVLVERMELDMELDRLGGPATEGISFSELTRMGRAEIDRGNRWRAYAFFRDAVARAPTDPVELSYTDGIEQIACALMNCATSTRSLGRYKLALHEFEYVHRTANLSPRNVALALERLATCHLALGGVRRAEELADMAVAAARQPGAREFLGYALYARAHAAIAKNDADLAVALLRETFRTYKNDGHQVGCALTLNTLAQCFFDARRHKAARRACDAAMRIAGSIGQERTRALSLILLGEIDEIENNSVQAVRNWKEAGRIGRTLRDKQLTFKSDFVLYKHARRVGNTPVARSIERRLTRLAPSIPPDTEELQALRMNSGKP